MQTYGPNSREALIPEAASPGLQPLFGDFEYQTDPSLPDDESYVSLDNPHSEAIDISGYALAGAVRFDFQAGTVIPAGSRLYIADDIVAFRARSQSPRVGERNFFQGGFKGRLHPGETLQLLDNAGHIQARLKIVRPQVYIPTALMGSRMRP